MNRYWYYALLLAIAAFVISMAVLWRDNTATDSKNDLTNWAATIFLLCVVCGPGLLAKQVFTLLVPVEQHAKNRRRLLREISRAETTREQAAATKTRIQLLRAWWEQERDCMHAIYMLNYKEAGGTKTENPYPRSTG
jgi:hypothetical protein